MGGKDKGLVEICGRPMVEFVIDSLRPHVASIILNANRNLEYYTRFGCPVVSDDVSGFLGPLAGILSGARAASTELILTAPCDSPLVPGYLTERLYQARAQANAEISVAHDGKRPQPVFSLFSVDLASSIDDFLTSGERKIDRWYERHHTVFASFADQPNRLANINRMSELRELEPGLSAGE